MGMRGTDQRNDRRNDRKNDRRRARGGSALYEPDYSPYGSATGQHTGYQTGYHTGYHTAARQPLAQARAELATRYAEAVGYDPNGSGTHQGSHPGSRSYRAWHESELSGASDVSLPRIRIAPGQRGYTGATRVVDAWPDYYPDQEAQASFGPSPTSARARVTASPLTREQRTVVIEHPWEEALGADESGLSVVGREFSQELDALISATSAQQRVVLPKAKPAGGKKGVSRAGALAALSVRLGVSLLILVGIMSGISVLTGHAPIPNLTLPVFGSTDAGAMAQFGVDANLLTRISPLTQLKRSDQYDNTGQFNAWGGSACSAAVLAETLTAYGVPNATIGHMIDELGSNISQQWGLVSYDGFAQVAAKHGLRADMYVDHPLTYAQMLYLTNTLHVPLIVNVRATSGYYHYLSGGHFLVMTGGDAQTVRLVDSSEYYIKSLPINTFMGMYRNRSVAIVPQDFHYTLPA